MANEIKTERIVVTIELDVVTFPSGSQWVTDLHHTDKIQTAINDARHELLGNNENTHLVTQEDIESAARQNLRDDSLAEANFKKVKGGSLFETLRNMLGVNCRIAASLKLNQWVEN
jgi:hypothetical protein